MPSGRLRLVVFSPHPRVNWSMSFQEDKTRTLDADIPQIIAAMERESVGIVEKINQANLEAERQRQQWAAL
ncbi:MAG: hypothetical protein WCJ87_08095 [Burkholderiales bacterium]